MPMARATNDRPPAPTHEIGRDILAHEDPSATVRRFLPRFTLTKSLQVKSTDEVLEVE